MQKHGVITAVSLLMAAGIGAQLTHVAVAEGDAERAVRQLEAESVSAAKRGDTAFFERALADDFTNVTAGGKSQTKRQAIEEIRSGDLKIRSLDVNDVKVKMYGNAAMMTGVSTLWGRLRQKDRRGREFDGVFNGSGRFTRVFENQGGRWRIVLNQTTPIPQNDIE